MFSSEPQKAEAQHGPRRRDTAVLEVNNYQDSSVAHLVINEVKARFWSVPQTVV